MQVNTVHQAKAGQGLKLGRDLEAEADAEAMEEDCLPGSLSRLVQLAFL